VTCRSHSWLFAVVTLFAGECLSPSYWVGEGRLALRVQEKSRHRQRQGDVHHRRRPDVNVDAGRMTGEVGKKRRKFNGHRCQHLRLGNTAQRTPAAQAGARGSGFADQAPFRFRRTPLHPPVTASTAGTIGCGELPPRVLQN